MVTAEVGEPPEHVFFKKKGKGHAMAARMLALGPDRPSRSSAWCLVWAKGSLGARGSLIPWDLSGAF